MDKTESVSRHCKYGTSTASGYTRLGRLPVLLAIALVAVVSLATMLAQLSSQPVQAGNRPVEGPETSLATVLSETRYLPLVMGGSVTPAQKYDMVEFMLGDGRLYEVMFHGGGQTRHQTQGDIDRFYHVKSESLGEWEEIWATEEYIYRGTDTSPGNSQYYTLRDGGMYGSKWSPRHWAVGELYERNPLVSFYYKANCAPEVSGTQHSWLLFEAHHDVYTFTSGITLTGVIQLAWLDAPESAPLERYFYARDFGLVGWQSSSGPFSYISEIHEPGARDDIIRETIHCLDPTAAPLDLSGYKPLPAPYRAK